MARPKESLPFQPDVWSGDNEQIYPGNTQHRGNRTNLGPVHGTNLSVGVLAAGNLLPHLPSENLIPFAADATANEGDVPGHEIEYDIREPDPETEAKIAAARQEVAAAYANLEQGEQ